IFHSCDAHPGHKHGVEPTDMGDMVEFANRLIARLKRPVRMIHMSVPRGRNDDAYFAPLEGLETKAGTELCLGLVHHTDGVGGTRARLATAKRFAQDFSIATEC